MRRTALLMAAVAAPIALVLLTSGASRAAISGAVGPDGTVSVSASSGGAMGGAPAEGGGFPGPGSGAGGSGSSPWSCSYLALVLNDQALPPGGPTPGGWYSMTCNNSVTGASFNQTLWISGQAPGAPVPAVDPHLLALQAERSLRLPSPELRFNPSGPSVVNLSTWLWIDGSLWHPYAITATAGSVSATAVATPVRVVWTMGDGGVVTCDGPGIPFDLDKPASQQSTSCFHTYRSSSMGEPTPNGDPNDAAFPVEATVTWSATWSAQGAPGGGVLPAVTTSSATSIRVEQVESIFGEAQVQSGARRGAA